MDVLDPQPPRVETAPCMPAAVVLSKLARWAGKQFTAALAPSGLKPRQLGTLIELRPGPLTQQSLGEALGIDAAQLVGLLNDLEAEQLVLRRRDPGDRRCHIVEISDLGRARLESTDRALAEVDARLMTGLLPEQREQFVTLLRFVATHGAYDEERGASEPEPCASEGDDFVPACPSLAR